MKHRPYLIRIFLCPRSGQKMFAPKGKKTEKNHKKAMYCPYCKKVHNFIQIGAKKGY